MIPIDEFDKAIYPIRMHARLAVWSALVAAGRVERQVVAFNAKVRAAGRPELAVVPPSRR